MKKYFADTNLYLRLILQDNTSQAAIAKKYFKSAQNGELEIIFIPEVLLEMEFVLRSVYKLSKLEIIKYFISLIKTRYLIVQERSLWIEILHIYKQKNISLFDIFLFFKAKQNSAEVLSFDKDFRKLST